MLYRLENHVPRTPAEGEYFVADNATVIGQVVLERHANIWFNTVIRGDQDTITVGEGSNIQDACVLHTDLGFPLTVGPGVTVGHQAMLHGCTIGENTLIGMKAIVLNGAVIGKNCLVGAGALIPEGKTIPDNSLVIGAPGRVKRELEAEEIETIRRTAPHYVENFRRYLTNFKII